MRNVIGIFEEVWAESGDRTEFADFIVGWDFDYSNPGSGKKPERIVFNDLFAKLTAIGVDINTYGATLPWHVLITYNQHARTTGSDGVVYRAASETLGDDPTDPASAAIWLPDHSTPEELAAHTEDVDNPHTVTAEQVGLGSAENTADLDKPISTATQTALDGKVDESDEGYVVGEYISGERKSFNPATDTNNEMRDCFAALLLTLKTKGII